MIKNILNFGGVEQLSREQKSSILGGVSKCCIRKPTNGFTEIAEDTADDGSWCNSSPECRLISRCSCCHKNGTC